MDIKTLLPKNTSTPSSPLSPERLEHLRRSVPLYIDSQGQWWHAEDPFKHMRLTQVFNRGLGWIPSQLCLSKSISSQSLFDWKQKWDQGDATVSVQDRWCYIQCDLTPFLGLKWKKQKTPSNPDHTELLLILNTDQELTVLFFLEHDDLLYTVGNTSTQSLLVRLSRHTQAQCASWLEEYIPDDVEDPQSTEPSFIRAPYQLHLNQKVYPIFQF